MLLSTKRLIGTKLEGVDAYLGTIEDLLFDDISWRLRYLVVDTGKWLPGRKVILDPSEVDQSDWSRGPARVARTREEIEASPPLGEHEPVSRQHEARMSAHFLWSHPGPVGPASVTGLGGAPASEVRAAAEELAGSSDGDPHLRSVEEVVGYGIHASDGEIGHVDQLVVDTSDEWRIRYLVVDTRNWLPGRKVLVAAAWAGEIRWDSREVDVDLARDVIKQSPEFDPDRPINRRYEERLYDYYGRPAYWQS